METNDNEIKRKVIFSTGFIIISLGALTQTLIGYFLQDNLSLFLFRKVMETEAIFWCFVSGSIGIIIQYLLVFSHTEVKQFKCSSTFRTSLLHPSSSKFYNV